MKKTLIAMLIVSVIAVIALCGCRANTPMPSALASILPSLPVVSPTPLATVSSVSTLPVASASAGASVAPSATK